MPLSFANKIFRPLRALIIATGVTSLAITSLSGCGGGGGGNNGSGNGTGTGAGLITPGATPFTNTRQATSTACVANPHVSGRARWTVLMYVNAASNLQNDSWLNVGQMASVGSDSSNVNIVVQWKQSNINRYFTQAGISPDPRPISQGGDGPPSFTGTRRYLIRPHSTADVTKIESGDVTPLDADRLPDPPTNTLTDTDPNGVTQKTADMGDYRTLQDFVQWGATNYPADHLAVVVWDHGSAALSITNNRAVTRASSSKTITRTTKPTRSRSVSFDTNSGSQITTQQIAQALSVLGTSGTQKNDMLIIDCSLEGTLEVAYEVRNVARAFVATEESPPHEGLPYDQWLTSLKQNGKNPCDVGNNIITEFINNPLFSDRQTQLTLSLTDLTQMPSVASALDGFGQALVNHLSDQGRTIATLRDADPGFDGGQYFDYKDLYSFADRVRSASVPSDMQQAAANLESALVSATSGAILATAHGNESTSDYGTFNTHLATGLSIHIPNPGQYESEYDTLALSQNGAAPHWAQFLKSQVQ